MLHSLNKLVLHIVVISLTACGFNEAEFPDGSGDSAGATTDGGTGGSGGDSTGGSTDGGGSTSGGDNATAPLAQYRLSNGGVANGTSINLIDDAQDPENMRLMQHLGSPYYDTDVDGNDFLRFTSVQSDETGGARLPIANTKFEEVHGSNALTLVAKYTVDDCFDTDHRIFGFSNGGFSSTDGMLIIRENQGIDFLRVR